MYAIYPKSKSVLGDFGNLISVLQENEQKKLMTTLAKYPKGVPFSSRVENIGRVEKKGMFWQYYAPGGCRIIYEVWDKPTKQLIVQFAGDHEEAAIWLRKNAKAR